LPRDSDKGAERCGRAEVSRVLRHEREGTGELGEDRGVHTLEQELPQVPLRGGATKALDVPAASEVAVRPGPRTLREVHGHRCPEEALVRLAPKLGTTVEVRAAPRRLLRGARARAGAAPWRPETSRLIGLALITPLVALFG